MKLNPVVLYSDASVYSNGQQGEQDAYYAVVLEDGTHDGLVIKHHAIGDKSVNEGEYEGVIAALHWLHDQDLDRWAVIITDSQLVWRHVMGDWRCNSPKLKSYRNRARHLLEATGATLIWKPRGENKAGWYFEGVVKERRKARARAIKEVSRSKRRSVRDWTFNNPEQSGYQGKGYAGRPRSVSIA